MLPSNAAEGFTDVTRNAGALSPGAGLAVFVACPVVTTVAAAWRLKRTDA